MRRSLFSLCALLTFAVVAEAQSAAVLPGKAEPVRVHRNHVASFAAAVDGAGVRIVASPGLTVWRSMTDDPGVVDLRAKASLPGCYSVTVIATKAGKISQKTFAVQVVAWPYRLLVSNREIRP